MGDVGWAWSFPPTVLTPVFDADRTSVEKRRALKLSAGVSKFSSAQQRATHEIWRRKVKRRLSPPMLTAMMAITATT